jgi:hypothetical protein
MAQKALVAQVFQARWHRLSLAETDASDHTSPACRRRAKDVRIIAVLR